MSQENVELVRRFYAFFESFTGGRVEPEEVPDATLAELFDPKVEWVPIPQGILAGSTYEGFEGLRRFAADFIAAWDEIHGEPQEFLDRGDQVIVILRVRGKMRQLEIDEVWSHLFTHRDGRIVRVQSFATREGALEAAGLRE
jgi:ketosteroid isomerase-like protein